VSTSTVSERQRRTRKKKRKKVDRESVLFVCSWITKLFLETYSSTPCILYTTLRCRVQRWFSDNRLLVKLIRCIRLLDFFY
jgi:hypothetical protein